MVERSQSIVIGVPQLSQEVKSLQGVQQLSHLVLTALFTRVYQLLISKLLMVPKAFPRGFVEFRKSSLGDCLKLCCLAHILIEVGC